MSRLIIGRTSLVVLATVILAGCNAGTYSALDGGVPGENTNSPVTIGNTPKSNDKLNLAKTQFRERNFGLAEKKFRAIVESEPRNAEAWLGLAASYDQLRRFKLADRAYKQVRNLNGASVAYLNNRGYSYLLRGDRRRAGQSFRSAQRLDPKNAFVKNNLRILAKRAR